MKNYEQYKRLVRFFAGLILVVVETSFYAMIWINYYNPRMEWPYVRLGHYFIAAVYGCALIVFGRLYGGFKLGYMRVFEAIYVQTLAAIITNGVMYIPIVLLTKHFQSLVPLMLMTVADFVIICLWSVISVRLYRKLYPPRNVVLIYGDRPISSLMGKIDSRMDRFAVRESVHVSAGKKLIKEKIDLYEGVVICDLPSHTRNAILKYCYGKAIRVYAIPKISDIIIRSAENLHLFDTPLILARNNGLTVEQRLAKRLLDILISVCAIIIFSPVMLITAVAIKACDGGPVLFFQDRCTINGRIFSICKFRSMVVDAEKSGEVLPATDGDPRITPIGNIIRKTRVDELPQLFNVLKGEMSLVGPRPERIEHVELYTKKIPEFPYRLKVKGGLTGYAQIYGKYNTTAYDKLKLDLMYIQNYSFFMDIEILFKTIKILFMKESTEGFSEEAVSEIHVCSNECTGDE